MSMPRVVVIEGLREIVNEGKSLLRTAQESHIEATGHSVHVSDMNFTVYCDNCKKLAHISVRETVTCGVTRYEPFLARPSGIPADWD